MLLLASTACTQRGGITFITSADKVTTQVAQTRLIPTLVMTPAQKNVIYFYGPTYHRTGKIAVQTWTHGLGPMAFDPHGDLYITDGGYPDRVGNSILIFKPPYLSAPDVISIGGGYADAVAIDWHRDIVAVVSNARISGARVFFYKIGEHVPCAKVFFAGGNVLDSVGAFDAEGALYLNRISNAPGFRLVSISGGCSPQQPVVYSPPFAALRDIEFNSADQLVVDLSSHNESRIATLPHPRGTQLASPLFTTVLQPLNGKIPNMARLSSDGNSIFAQPWTGAGLAQYAYPQGGAPLYVFDWVRNPYVAVYPQLVPSPHP